MPRIPKTNVRAVETQSEAETLILEQTLAFYREMKAAAQNAPHGKVVDAADSFSFNRAPELLRKNLAALLQEQIEEVEKKKKLNVLAVERKNTADIKRKPS